MTTTEYRPSPVDFAGHVPPAGPALTPCMPGCQAHRNGSWSGDCHHIVDVAKVPTHPGAYPTEFVDVQVQHANDGGVPEESVITLALEPSLSDLIVLGVADADLLIDTLAQAISEARQGRARLAGGAR